MTRATPHVDRPDQPARSWPRRCWDRVPLVVRNAFYGTVFLGCTFGLIPWAFHRVDVYGPAWHVELPPALRLAGAVGFAAFLLIYLVCSYVLTSRGRGGYVEFDPPQQFVATGIYRWCRNPVAGSVVVMLFAEAIALSSTGIGLFAILSVPLAHLQVTRLEEPLLHRRFGQDYADYVARVPRWWPRRPREDPS